MIKRMLPDPLGFKDKPFYSMLLRLALPIAVQQFFGAMLHIVDTIMVSGLGVTEVAAVGLASQYSFIANLFFFGITSGAGVFISQFWGAKDPGGVHKVFALALLVSLGVGAVFFIPAFFAPGMVLSVFSPDPEVIAQGSSFIRIIAWTYLLSPVIQVYSVVLRSTESVRLPTVASVAGLLFNTGFNYLIIFGNWGMPRLGVAGAALSTVIASVLMLLIILLVSYSRRNIVAVTLRQLRPPGWAFIRQYLRVALPVVLNEGIWGVGIASYSIVYGHMGTHVAAAMNIFSTIDRLVISLTMSQAHATAVMVGIKIGAGEESTAMLYGRRLTRLAALMGIVLAAVLYLCRFGIGSLFNIGGQIDASVMNVMFTILTISCLYSWARFYNTVNIVGVLRGGGDTKFCLFLDILPMWLFSVPAAFALGLGVHLTIEWLYPIILIDELVKFFAGHWRQRSGKWIRNLTHLTEAQQEVTT